MFYDRFLELCRERGVKPGRACIDDEELTEYLDALRTRPEIKMMFQLTKDATKEDVEKAVKVIEAMFGKG